MINKRSLSEQIEDALKKEILEGRLAANQRISIDELAKKWEVSTMPVRDAIKQLESKGFVKVSPRSGVHVSDLDRKTFRDIFDIRIALECLAVETATELIPDDKIQRLSDLYKEAEKQLKESGVSSLMIKHDADIHKLIIQYCDNPKLIQIMDNLRDLMDWASNTIVTNQPESYEIGFSEHKRILAALLERDAESAQLAMRDHLRNSSRRAYESWKDSE